MTMKSFFTFLLAGIFTFSAEAQQSFENYITLPAFEAGYSRQTRADRLVYENYTDQNQIQQRWQILAARPLPADGKLNFAEAWKSAFPDFSADAAAPRYRRLYTQQSIPFFAGGMETSPVDGLGYVYLAAIPINTTQWQPVIIWTTDAKTARPLTYQWIERLQGAQISGVK